MALTDDVSPDISAGLTRVACCGCELVGVSDQPTITRDASGVVSVDAEATQCNVANDRNPALSSKPKANAPQKGLSDTRTPKIRPQSRGGPSHQAQDSEVGREPSEDDDLLVEHRALGLAIARRLRLLDSIRREVGVVHVRAGQVVSGRREASVALGTPDIYHDAFGGPAPIHDERAIQNGFIYSREDYTFSVPGGHSTRSRVTRVPDIVAPELGAVPPAPVGVTGVRRDSLRAQIVRNFPTLCTLALFLRDEELLPPIPSRAVLGDAETRKAVRRLAELRQERHAIRSTKRTLWALPVRHWIEGLGGRVRAFSVRINVLYVTIPSSELEEVLADPRVRDVSLEGLPAGRPDALSPTYLCTGLPSLYYARPPDDPECDVASTTVEGFLDGKVAAMGGLQYTDAGYDGSGSSAAGGLSTWSEDWESTGGTFSLVPHLTLAVVDGTRPDPRHPAFKSAYGSFRCKYFVSEAGDIYTEANFPTYGGFGSPPRVIDLRPTEGHGTSVAGCAIGSVVDGQDARVPTGDYAMARSGVARRALAVFSAMSIPETLDLLIPQTTTVELDGSRYTYTTTPIDGVDVMVDCTNRSDNSTNENYGPLTAEGYYPYPCPSDDQARGIDATSLALVDAYLDDALVYVKSAGNTHDTRSGAAATRCVDGDSAPYEVSCPGASPVAVSVGALKNGDLSPSQMQESAELYAASAGIGTPDGRSYPLLVSVNTACGTPASRVLDLASGSLDVLEFQQIYKSFGATSGATPMVGGATLLFKHWYLANHGADCANSPGRLISNILNFADGVAYDAWSGGSRTSVPSSPWGLGRFVMRLFETEAMGGDWLRGTASKTLTDGMKTDWVSLGGDTDIPVPRDARRLRITIWWVEVNTGEGEVKADLWAYLFHDAGGTFELLDYRNSGGECVMRMQYDCHDSVYDAPPHGVLKLLLSVSGAMPAEVRGGNQTSRTLYVSWFWETGDDMSRVDVSACGTSDACSLALQSLPGGLVVNEGLVANERAIVLSLDAILEGQFGRLSGQRIVS